MLIGGSMGGLITDQGTYQRFLSVPTRRHGQMYKTSAQKIMFNYYFQLFIPCLAQ